MEKRKYDRQFLNFQGWEIELTEGTQTVLIFVVRRHVESQLKAGSYIS